MSVPTRAVEEGGREGVVRGDAERGDFLEGAGGGWRFDLEAQRGILLDGVEDVFGNYWTVIIGCGIRFFVMWEARFHDGVFARDALALANASE